MNEFNFFTYLPEFEKRVVESFVLDGCIKKEKIPIRAGKLANATFGRKLGGMIDSMEIFAIDYYGHIKRSKGLIFEFHTILANVPEQVKSVEAPLVYFASIRFEKVAKYAPDLVADFRWFKKNLLDMRGFNHNYEV